MLRADGQADGVRPDALIEQLLRRELGVRRRGRVDDEALDVRDVGQQGEDLQMVDEAVRLGLAARDAPPVMQIVRTSPFSTPLSMR